MMRGTIVVSKSVLLNHETKWMVWRAPGVEVFATVAVIVSHTSKTVYFVATNNV